MNEELKAKLKEQFDLTDENVADLETKLGIKKEEHLAFLDSPMLATIGILPIPAKALIMAYANTTAVAPEAGPEIAAEQPSPKEVNDFAAKTGIDSNMLTAFLFATAGSGAGMDMDLSSFMPIDTIVRGYSPKRRDMSLMIMGQIQRRLGTDIVVINADGSVNHELTQRYILELEEGWPAKEGVYTDEAGVDYEIVAVGVDAQGIYDADPLDSTHPLDLNGHGIGRINWKGVPMDVRQLVYYAVQTGEFNAGDTDQLRWMRTTVKSGVTFAEVRGEFPKAITVFNQAARSGALPTLRVTLSRSPRRKEVFPRRRVGSYHGEGDRVEGAGFRNNEQ